MSSYDPRLIPFVSTHEGRSLKAYRCPANVITIGDGFTDGSGIFRSYWMKTRGHKLRMGDTITNAECDKLLTQLINAEYAPKPLSMFRDRLPHQKAAGIDMPYNAGLGSLKWKWALALQAGRISDAAAKYRVTAVTSRGRKLPGLVRRRREMALIMERNVWPSWLRTGPVPAGQSAPIERPWRLAKEDIMAAQKILNSLGYGPLVEDGIDGKQTSAAVLKFQRTHPQLTNDGKLGRATYSALQRARNLKQEAGGAAATTGGTAGVGATETTAMPEWLLWGGLTAAVVVGGYLIWTYRDEIKAMLRKL